jgi:tetratricopeptide (TPR) repeat protein
MKKNWVRLIVFPLLLSAFYPAFSFAQTGSLYITSTPAGANILLDNTPIPKKTNTLLQGVPVGNHKVTLEYPGMRKMERTVEVKEGLTSEISVEFQGEKPKEVAVPPKKQPVPAAKPKEAATPSKKAPAKAPETKPEPSTLPQPEPSPGMETLNRGLALLEKKRYDLAVAEFSKALEADPQLPSAYEKRAFAYLILEQYKSAAGDLKKAIALDPKNSAPYYFHLGFAFFKIDEKKDSEQSFLRAKDLDKDIVEKWVRMLEKTADPNIKKIYVETILSASQYLDISSRVVARAKEMVKEISLGQESFFTAFLGGGYSYIFLLLSGGILLLAGVLYLVRRKGKTLPPKRTPTPRAAAVRAATPVECVKVARTDRDGGLRETTIVGNYQIVEKIASGGMANIYKAVHINQGGFAVLKIPYEQFLNDPKFVDRFRREAELGRKLYNENIINIYESATTEDGVTYIAMEYLEGTDLRRYLNKHGKVAIPDALKILTRVCRALDYAHIKGVIHRDIKPENIMLPHDLDRGRIVLMDFGVAHATYMCTVATRTTFIGTPYYMSPDQLSGEEVDARSDIYSLGVVFFEMLTGERPFNEKDALKVLIQHQKALPPRPSSLNREIPPELDIIILRMLAKEPTDRFQSMEDLLVALKDYMLREGIEVV